MLSSTSEALTLLVHAVALSGVELQILNFFSLRRLVFLSPKTRISL